MVYFFDPVHGKIRIEEPFSKIVETNWFNRLRHLRQMGLCYLAFPGGNHTRFEHSIGAFRVASFVIDGIRELGNINDDDFSIINGIIKYSALCHDVGHGPFSHMTENVLNSLGLKVTHEEVGASIIKFFLNDMINKYDGVSFTDVSSVLLKKRSVNRLVNMVIDLVSSDLDVDRIDYLCRDSYYTGFWTTYRGINIKTDLKSMFSVFYVKSKKCSGK